MHLSGICVTPHMQRILFIHLRFIVMFIIITMLGFGDVARCITDLYPVLMYLFSRLFLL